MSTKHSAQNPSLHEPVLVALVAQAIMACHAAVFLNIEYFDLN